MNQYIDKDKLHQEIQYYQQEMDWGEEWNKCLDVVLAIINNQPVIKGCPFSR